jgi:hypothetical protein
MPAQWIFAKCFFLKTGLILLLTSTPNRITEHTKGSLYKGHEVKLELLFR